jgi:hypothetical protein
MAWRVLTLLSALMLASIAARAETISVTYRTGTVVAIDAPHHALTVDAPGASRGPVAVESDVDIAGIHVGDAVMFGERTIDGALRIVHLRRATAPAAAAALTDASAYMTTGGALSATGARRPMLVVPNPRAPGESRTVETSPREPAVFVEPEDKNTAASLDIKTVAVAEAPAEPEPSSLEISRVRGVADLEQALIAMDATVREVDLLWGAYRQGCPTAEGSDARGWLRLASTAPATEGACAERRRQLEGVVSHVRAMLDTAETRARAASVLPGQIRRLLQAYGLEAR